MPNFLRAFVVAALPKTTADPYTLTLDTTYEQTLVNYPSALLDHLNRLLCAGTLPAAAKTRIITALSAVPSTTTAEDKVKTAILLTLTSPASAIQR